MMMLTIFKLYNTQANLKQRLDGVYM